MMSNKLKEEFIKLLEKDIEFRYTVAGYLGLLEILKRLDRIEENINRIWENINKLWENQNKLIESQRNLIEIQNRLVENQNNLIENQNRLVENQNKLTENQNRLWEEIKNLREEHSKRFEKIEENISKLWENQNKLIETQNIILNRLYLIENLQKRMERGLTTTYKAVEDAAREMFEELLINKYKIAVKIEKLKLEEIGEINIFGTTDSICFIGEIETTAEEGILHEINRKIELILKKYPDIVKDKKIIKILITGRINYELLNKAKEMNIYVILWDRELIPLPLSS